MKTETTSLSNSIINDYQTYKAFAVEVMFNLFGEPVEYGYIPVHNLRFNEDKTIFWYNEDWEQSPANSIEFKSFDSHEKNDTDSKIFYVESNILDEPTALIKAYISNIPTALIKAYVNNRPTSIIEELQEIYFECDVADRTRSDFKIAVSKDIYAEYKTALYNKNIFSSADDTTLYGTTAKLLIDASLDGRIIIASTNDKQCVLKRFTTHL